MALGVHAMSAGVQSVAVPVGPLGSCVIWVAPARSCDRGPAAAIGCSFRSSAGPETRLALKAASVSGSGEHAVVGEGC